MLICLAVSSILGYLGLGFTASQFYSLPLTILLNIRYRLHNLFTTDLEATPSGLSRSIHLLLSTPIKTMVSYLHTDIFMLYLREILGVFTLYFVVTILHQKVTEKGWAQVATRKKASIDKLAASLRNLLGMTYKPDAKKSQLILKSNVSGLLKHLRQRTLTSVDLLNFYTERCLTKAYDLNLISDFLYPTALKQAEAIDAVYETNKNDSKWVPPRLYGIPISIKDVYEIEGHDCTMGSAYKCFKPCTADGTIIKMLKDEGAIPFVMSTCPQLLLINETHNRIFGRAMNPWDKKRSPGGSSGGEAGLISLGCSP
jgi:fatty acid amide hydrolase